MGKTALHFAVKDRKTDKVTVLLHHGAHIHNRDDSGRTPLFECALPNNSSENVGPLLQLLLDRGALRSDKDKQGNTIFHILAHSKDKEQLHHTLEFLLQYQTVPISASYLTWLGKISEV